MRLDSTGLSQGAKPDLKSGQAKIYQFWWDIADITGNKQKVNEWMFWSVLAADNFLHSQLCWFRLGTFNCGLVSRKMGLHGSCRSVTSPAKPKELKGRVFFFFWTPHILKSTLQNLRHPSWASTDSFCFPYGPVFCSLTTFRIHIYLLCIGSIYEGVRLLQQTISLIFLSWLLSMFTVMPYVYFDCLLVRSSFVHNPVNVTALMGFETGLRRGRIEVTSTFQ